MIMSIICHQGKTCRHLHLSHVPALLASPLFQDPQSSSSLNSPSLSAVLRETEKALTFLSSAAIIDARGESCLVKTGLMIHLSSQHLHGFYLNQLVD
jgi:hypothetical protein